MKLAPGSVAVVTGAAGGIGLALAHEAVRRGLKVAVGDIREDALAAAAESLTKAGGEVLAMRVDATRREDIEALAEAAFARFGKVNLLVNNAGAFVAGLAWETSPEQFDWVVDLNMKSVLHGFRAFVPRMIAQGDPCHVATVASAAGITVYPGYAAYSSTKHAALAMTEALRLDLEAEGISHIGVTIVMPGMVRTAIMEPEKASPAALDLARQARFENRTVRAIEAMMSANLDVAMAPEALAEMVFEAMDAGKLYVLPNHDSLAHQAVGRSIGDGRATGADPFPPIMARILASMDKADTAATKAAE
jgi:NADP-dependent 3-hydroxy acid dehydrogenase YdfG